jgi:hypothetical protein
VDATFTEADRGVERGESAKTDGDGRHGSARPKRAVFVLEDRNEIWGHKDRLQVEGDESQGEGRREKGDGETGRGLRWHA